MADEPIQEPVLTEEEAAAAAVKEAEWQKTLRRLGLGEVDVTNVSADDILYIAERWQFLQVVEGSGKKTPLEHSEILTAKSGWTIIHYGDAMTTSPGKYLFGGGYFRVRTGDDDDDEGGGIVNPKKGTIFKQAFDSAAEMIQLAKEMGWGSVQIVDGHPYMQKAAWVEACRIGVKLDGFIPDVEAEKTRRRIVSATLDEMHASLKGAPPSRRR